MKIVDFEVIRLRGQELKEPVKPAWAPGSTWTSRGAVLVKITTDEGIVGWGAPGYGDAPTIESWIKPQLLGQDPFALERHARIFRNAGGGWGIEIALWDIIGKATNQPIYNLLGGQFHQKLRAYAYMPSEGIWEQPEKAGEIARQLVAEGWSACKTDPFQPTFPYPRDWPLKEIKHAASIFRHIREAVGDELEVGIGTHSQFSTAGAIRVAKIFEEYYPIWFEEPVPPEMVEEMARVAAQTSIPIASGERLATKYDFANALEKQAIGIVQVDVGQCGGILEAKKIAAIAEAHHALIAPHMYVGPIAAAAAIQLDTCSANFMIQEYNVNQLHADIFVEPIRVENGYITPPTGPGLGVELNEEVVKRHRSA
jgi:2-dehydro-3-deoxyphosphogalactonate aldolase